MKWKWSYLYIAIGGTFIVKMIENGRTNSMISEAHQIREATKKPILLISTRERPGFDAYINPNQTVVWQLPYLNKAFGVVVSDSLEDIAYPKEAIAEWQRIADSVLINTHSIFSPEGWLDFRHQHVFFGDRTIPVNPSLNWAIGGGIAYYMYRRQQRKKLAKSQARQALPGAEEIIDEITEEEPLEAEEIIEEIAEEEPPKSEEIIDEIAEELPKRKALPAPVDGIKVEPAPIINPDELDGNNDILDGIDLTSGVNLGIGSDGVFAEQLEKKGVTNLIFNPMNMPREHNQAVIEQLDDNPADSATLIDILSKVKNPKERQGAVQVAFENVRQGGRVFIKDKNPRKYLQEVKQIFPNAKLKKGIIIATKS